LEGEGEEDLGSGDIPVHGHMLAEAGEACPGAGRTVTLCLRLMPCMGLPAPPGPMPHTVCRKDMGIDIHIMDTLIDGKEKRRQTCITEITHMEDGLLPGDPPWEWVTLGWEAGVTHRQGWGRCLIPRHGEDLDFLMRNPTAHPCQVAMGLQECNPMVRPCQEDLDLLVDHRMAHPCRVGLELQGCNPTAHPCRLNRR
jgi:hypothetical protein